MQSTTLLRIAGLLQGALSFPAADHVTTYMPPGLRGQTMKRFVERRSGSSVDERILAGHSQRPHRARALFVRYIPSTNATISLLSASRSRVWQRT